MPYSEATATISLLPGMPQTSASAGYSLNVSLLTDHITRADNLINAKIASRYDISSFSTNPSLLILLSQDISSYYLMRSQYSSDDQNLNEWTMKFKESIAILDQIRNGDMDLVGEDSALISEDNRKDTITSSTEDFDPTFNEGPGLNQQIDSTKLDGLL